MHYETEFFEKAEYLIKAVKKYFKKKNECLGITYKSGGLNGKLLKMTIYIYIKEFIHI